MKHILAALFSIIALSSCHSNNTTVSTTNSGDSSFQKIADDYLAGYLAWRPLTAVSLGLHNGYDGKTTNYSKPSLDSELSRLKSYDAKLAMVDTASLSPKQFIDYRILSGQVKEEIYTFEDLDRYSTNPMAYAGAVDVDSYIKRNFAPLEERVGYIISTDKAVPAIVLAAKTNLKDSLPKPLIQTAVNMLQGDISFLKGDLLIALKDVKNDTLMAALKRANDTAIAACNDFVNWLQKEKLPKANNKYAIGEDNYKKMLLYGEGITMAPEQILAIGLKQLKAEQEEFNAAAHIIDPNKKPIDVYHDLQKEHPVADSLIPVAKERLEAIRQFLIDHKICTMPSEVRVQVKETPQYARATTTASMDEAGPFEAKATESFYYITPIDPTWTPQQKEDWLKQFDYYTSDNISVHEVYPGHYTQGLHLKASNASEIEKIFGSYAYVEGWAHYCEKMMIEQGYGADKDSITTAKHRLAMSGDALLRICRLCVSIKIHCQAMSMEDGTKFLMNNWYQGEKPSSQEALRGTFDPGYLFYNVGKLEILKLREDYKQQEGANYSLQKFNDAMTDNGMPPIRLMREILLKDKSKWNDIL